MSPSRRVIGAGRLAGLAALLVIPTLAEVARADDGVHTSEGHWCLTCAGIGGDNTSFFQPVTRWSTTFTNGSGLGQGDHTTLTWSIVPDGTIIPAAYPGSGEVTGPSDMIAAWDSTFGAGPGGSDYTQRPWFWLLESSFDRWSELAALDYIYVTDDGVEMNGSNAGSATRGDVRIGGHNISGAGSILAYNYFPNRGDMVHDTSDMAFYGNAASNFVRARNIVAHEHGHGMGISHLESASHSFLMEPFLNASFDGPQFDDILSAQRLYGDVLEKNGGNDTAGNAYDFGAISQGSGVSIGFDAVDAVVAYTDTSFVSIDDESDVDVFSFTVAADTGVLITLLPVGPAYLEGAQTGNPATQTNFYSYALSDLTLTLLDTDGASILQFADLRDLGEHERIFQAMQNAGTYYIQVGGLTSNIIQMYQLDVAVGAVPEPAGATLLVAAAALMLRRRRAA